MDVRCQKCGIEYEFDDAKVTVAGVTVKCTSCGHVFKVKKEEPAPPSGGSSGGSFGAAFGGGAVMQDLPRTATATTLPPVTPKADGTEWMVRQPSGTVFRFKELTTLQKWIVERKVNREDEISKTGKSWKRLGDIAELASFFQVVDAANAALNASVVPVQPAMSSTPMPPMGAQPAPPASAQQVQPGFVVVHQHQTGGTQVGMPAMSSQATAQAPGGQPSVQGATPDAQPPPPQAPAVPVQAQKSPKKPAGPERDELDELDDDDPVAQWGKQRRRRNAAVLFLLALVVAVGVLFVLKPPFLAALLGDDAAASLDVDSVYRAVRDDDATAQKAARTGLGAAAPSPLATALTARLLCAEASIAREEERLHGVLRSLVPADAAQHDAEADRANQRASELLTTAYPLVAEARAQAPKLAEAHLAAAAYNLEKGGLSELKSDLETARSLVPADERGRLDAEIGVLQVLADVRPIVEKQDASVVAAVADKVPMSTDARLRYMKAALVVTALARTASAAKPGDAAPDLTLARTLVDALAVKDARHALLTDLLRALDKPAAVADAGVASADAGVVDAGSVAGADAGSAGEKIPETFEGLMQQAERASVNEKTALARELFSRAVKLKPGSARANLGLGWACLGLEKNAEAQKAFRKAIAIDDGISDAHMGLAEALRYGGDKAGALEEYKKYLEMDPTGKDASVARRAIEALQ